MPLVVRARATQVVPIADSVIKDDFTRQEAQERFEATLRGAFKSPQHCTHPRSQSFRRSVADLTGTLPRDAAAIRDEEGRPVALR